MQRREQYLLIGLVGAVVLWGGASLFHSTFVVPMQAKRKELDDLQKSISQRNAELIQLARQGKSLKAWKERSLPPDAKLGKSRADALNAQRLYQDWLHDLAQTSGFEDLKVSPERRNPSRDNVFISVSIKIEAEARYEQLCRFLDRFYRADLLHRITALRIQSKESEGDPFLQVELEAEGLAVMDTPVKNRLFAQTVLIEELTEDATELKVDSTDDFPKEPGFLVRVKNEFLKVTAIDGTTWTVDRAVDNTTAGAEPAGTIVERVRTNDDARQRTPEELKQLLASNLFVKPAPPVEYKPRISPISEKTLIRGKPLEFSIVTMGYDPAKGKPEYLLTSDIPGSRMDKSLGRFSWTPTKDQKAGKYTFKIEVKHPSAPQGRLTETVTVMLREPNTPPRLAVTTPPTVYLGREWQFTPQAVDAETAAGKLSWKLGDNPPKGIQIEARTGKLTWTPDDSIEIGEANVPITVTDDGSPPQTATSILKLKVEDDAAMFTYLTTIFAVNNNVLAKLYDRSQDKFTELRVGTRFAVADVRGTVTKIDKKFLEFASGDETVKLQIGQNLREVAPEPVLVDKTGVESAIPDALHPVNVTKESGTAAVRSDSGSVSPPREARPVRSSDRDVPDNGDQPASETPPARITPADGNRPGRRDIDRSDTPGRPPAKVAPPTEARSEGRDTLEDRDTPE